jgi:hypothetical protein
MRLDIGIVGVGVLLAGIGCNRGKSKDEVFTILDKHRIDYGRCEVMAQSKDQVDGKPAWIAANVCRVKFKQDVLAEVGESSKFEDWFEDWKKEKGAKATQDAKSAPPPKTTSKAGDDCPSGAACLNRCRSECEGKHGTMIDSAAMMACAKGGGKPEECSTKATNATTKACFMKCRGL